MYYVHACTQHSNEVFSKKNQENIGGPLKEKL